MSEPSTPRQRRIAVSEPKLWPRPLRDTEVTPARGHVAELFFRFRSVIGQAAMNPP